MKVKIIANKPESSDCENISELIGQEFDVLYFWEGSAYVSAMGKAELGLFDGEYEIVE